VEAGESKSGMTRIRGLLRNKRRPDDARMRCNSARQRANRAQVDQVTAIDGLIRRWREAAADGSRVQRKKTIGDLSHFPTKKSAWIAVENLRAEINAAEQKLGKPTVADAWGHFQVHELHDPDVGRSPSTIYGYLDYFKNQILPHWGKVCLDDLKAVEVERWLRGLDLANGTKAKIRNHMSALFSHAIRHELYSKINPISSVRQSAVRERDPDILTIKEMEATIAAIEPQAIRLMVMVAATTAIRRSELRGLRWADVDFAGLKLNLRRGLFRKEETAMKTKASRKPVPILPELAEALLKRREETPYPSNTDWIFASPFTEGKRPYWAESALTDHIRPAAIQAGVKKHIGWHTFRHSVATLLGQNREDVKVVQELLRHATTRITMEVYQQAGQDATRAALTPFSGIFVVLKKAS
jgi:integrase